MNARKTPSDTARARAPGAAGSFDGARLEALRHDLPSAIEHLRCHQASRIPAADIAAYVALDWLEWHGGALRLTEVGTNIRRQLVNEAQSA